MSADEFQDKSWTEFKTAVIICYECNMTVEIPEAMLDMMIKTGCPYCGTGTGILIDPTRSGGDEDE